MAALANSTTLSPKVAGRNAAARYGIAYRPSARRAARPPLRCRSTANLSQTYQYDLVGRVKQGTGLWGSDNYTYDAMGNRLTRSLGTQFRGHDTIPGTQRNCGIRVPGIAAPGIVALLTTRNFLVAFEQASAP